MRCQFRFFALLFLLCIPASPEAPATVHAQAQSVQRSRETRAALKYAFSPDDEQLLNEVQHAAFLYFWKEVGDPVPLVKDRKLGPVASIAAVGFQLSSLPIGVERKWVTRAAAEERARRVLHGLLQRDDNRKFGIYLHFPDLNTGGLSHEGYEIVASTVDHALFLAGALTAGEYFGGEVNDLAERLARESNWRAFETGADGLLSMGWRPNDPSRMDGPGKLLEWKWWIASDEERLIYFLATGSPTPEHALAPETYYRLKRELRQHESMPPFAVSWPGTLFTYFFSHCWIDYRELGPDDPAGFGVEAPAIDWFENSRRAVLTQRQRCIEAAEQYGTLSADRWGLSACASRDGYIVPEILPNLVEKDRWFEGTVAPYASASAIMFAPAESMAAIRAIRGLRHENGSDLVWRDPKKGGYGFVDSFNLDQQYAHEDYVGIDMGAMLLAIENARTGLVWKLFMQSDSARRAVERLKLRPDNRR